MVGNEYWSTGITLRYMPENRWSARCEFFDGGFCDNASTEGVLRTRYFGDLAVGLDTLIADAQRFGIVFHAIIHEGPHLLYEGDGENKDWPPPANYRQTLAEQAQRIGWVSYEAPQ